jgi:hypothetical protein
MQYWIFYQAGVGGDGFGCMLEHATNINPADGNLEWRIHYYENAYGVLQRPVRFYQAKWTEDPLPFRHGTLIDNVVLNPVYTNLVEQQQNTVITAHEIYFHLIDKFKHRSIVEKDQIKIHLYSNNNERVYRDLLAKRGGNFSAEQFKKLRQHINKNELARTAYDMHIDIEKIWRDWNYTQSCMDQLGIDLPKSVYDHYLTYIDNL